MSETSTLPNNIQEILLNAKSWPFQEAKRILERVKGKVPKKGYVLLETGYGPSGLPHIGTFGEVARTSMVRYAFNQLSDIPTQLFTFSDDMDGLRKVPDNVPNQDMLRQHLGKPLTNVPDPYEKYESFGHHNNAMLCRFLDSFNFDYTFQSSTQWYKSGRFNEYLKLILQHYDEIMAIMLPTLRDERKATYSPFLPVCPNTGIVLQVPIKEIHLESNSIIYDDPNTHKLIEVPVTGGHCKLQWKVDWGMRWRAFDVDYEMSGKDLIDSVKASTQICKIIGGNSPISYTYEHFLDEKGQKISKSKGNGLTIDEWLTYAPSESLAYYMFLTPHRAKRLYFDVIPKATDEYLNLLEKYSQQELVQQIENAIYHIHQNNPPQNNSGLSFGILLNLASVCNTDDPLVLWGFVKKYIDQATPENMPYLDKLIKYSIAYYQNFIKPQKEYREPSEAEHAALIDLYQALGSLDQLSTADIIQGEVFAVGKRHNFLELRAWFGTLYEVLLGQKEGPRIGSFIALYGIDNMRQLIKDKLNLNN